MKPHTPAAEELLAALRPHCREHGGQLFSEEALADTLSRVEDEAVDIFLEQRRAAARERALA